MNMPGSRMQPGANPKILAVAIFIFGLVVVGFGVYRIQQQIFSPFKLPVEIQNQINQVLPKTEDQELAEMKVKDTDQDGLTDYDEIVLYSTSPYIQDTDSDGRSDSTEIKNGTDPNCVEGQDCNTIRLVGPDTKISDLFPQFSDTDVSLKDKTLQEFRSILLQQGYDKDKLASISDDMLLLILEESLNLQSATASTTATSTTSISSSDLDKVRQFLIDAGASPEEVYSLSNKEIEDILRTFK